MAHPAILDSEDSTHTTTDEPYATELISYGRRDFAGPNPFNQIFTCSLREQITKYKVGCPRHIEGNEGPTSRQAPHKHSIISNHRGNEGPTPPSFEHKHSTISTSSYLSVTPTPLE